MNQAAIPFTAVVLAGDRSPDDPVAKATGVSCKALVPVGGTPMVLRVLGALSAAQEIENRILCGPQWSAIEHETELRNLIESGDVKWITPQATPSSSAYAVMQTLSEQSLTLITTADHALLSTRIVDYFCSKARMRDCDVVVGVVPHELVAQAYPGVRRTVFKLRDGGFCGCNLFAFLTQRARTAADLWRRVENERKYPLRLIRTFGWVPVLRYLTGRLSLEEGFTGISNRLGLRIGSIVIPFPEAAVDVDTMNDWRLVQSIVGGGVP